jgi:hypothetical protein
MEASPLAMAAYLHCESILTGGRVIPNCSAIPAVFDWLLCPASTDSQNRASDVLDSLDTLTRLSTEEESDLWKHPCPRTATKTTPRSWDNSMSVPIAGRLGHPRTATYRLPQIVLPPLFRL